MQADTGRTHRNSVQETIDDDEDKSALTGSSAYDKAQVIDFSNKAQRLEVEKTFLKNIGVSEGWLTRFPDGWCPRIVYTDDKCGSCWPIWSNIIYRISIYRIYFIFANQLALIWCGRVLRTSYTNNKVTFIHASAGSISISNFTMFPLSCLSE